MIPFQDAPHDLAACLAGHGASEATPPSTLHDLHRWDRLVPATAELLLPGFMTTNPRCRLKCLEIIFFFLGGGGTSFSFSLKLSVKTTLGVWQKKKVKPGLFFKSTLCQKKPEKGVFYVMEIELLMVGEPFGVLVHCAKVGRSRKKTELLRPGCWANRTLMMALVTRPLWVLWLWEEGWDFLLIHIFSLNMREAQVKKK